jgi:hypothetical protein
MEIYLKNENYNKESYKLVGMMHEDVELYEIFKYYCQSENQTNTFYWGFKK